MTNISVCLLAKNEEKSIAEWLAYYKLIGFDELFVYDNGSTDRTCDVVQQAIISEPTITYVSWPDKEGRKPQVDAYKDVLTRCRTEWISFFDTDEFFVPKQDKTVIEYLSRFNDDVTALAINWLVFGSNDQLDASNDLVIDRFVRCAPVNHGKNRIFKSIVRAASIESMIVHAANLRHGFYSDSSGRPVEIEIQAKTPRPCFELAQLNHYIVKSRQEFIIKQQRGHSNREINAKDKYTNVDEVYWNAHNLNDSEDHSIKMYSYAVKDKLREWGFSNNHYLI